MQVASLKRGKVVTLTWSFRWPGVADSLGGTPQLVRNGRVVAEACGASICGRHPRTGVGVSKSGRVLLVVDGRRAGSRGLTLVEFARLFRTLGARSAVNLDGGGSSTMVFRGRIVNRPSDGSERAVSSAILVLRGKDKREHIRAPGQAGTKPPEDPSPLVRYRLRPRLRAGRCSTPRRPGGSSTPWTGGSSAHLPAELRPALRTFRDAR